MQTILTTPRLALVPVRDGDEDALCTLLWQPEVRRYLCDDALMPRETVRQMIADSLDPASITTYWRIQRRHHDCAGLIGLWPPSTASLQLRAIGWRSLELIVALDHQIWGQGLATEAVAAVAEHAGADGVTFALVAGVDEPNERSNALMRRCGFAELGRATGSAHPMIIYELAL